MSPEPPLTIPESGLKKGAAVRLWVISVALGVAACTLWFAWPCERDPFQLSLADGKLRFVATSRSKMNRPPYLRLIERLKWDWEKLAAYHRKPNPGASSFPASPLQLWSMNYLLDKCMEVSGTRYLIGVDICGAAIAFGSTNALNGTQWVAAAERAIEQSDSVVCYDYRTRHAFKDRPLLIREGPGLIKVIPRSKLAEYQKAGLVKAGAAGSWREQRWVYRL